MCIRDSTMIGAMAMIEAAESLAQNCPSGLEYSEMKKLKGAAYLLVRLSDQKASFHARIRLSRQVETMPGTAIGVRILVSSLQSEAPSMRAASRISPGISLK